MDDKNYMIQEEANQNEEKNENKINLEESPIKSKVPKTENNQLKGGEAFLGVLKDEEENLIEKSSEYQNIRNGWYDEKAKLEEIAKDFLDSEGVTHKAIREAYIDKFIDDNDTLWDDLQQYKSDMKYRVLTELYLVFAKTIKDEERTKQVANNQITNIQELLNKVADFMVYTETEDYIDEKKDLLPAI